MGLTEEEFDDLENYEKSDLFTEVEKRVLEYVSRLTRNPAEIPDELFNSLASDFEPRELVELTALAAWENYRARFNRGFDLEAQGFSEGSVCRIPDHQGLDDSAGDDG